MRNELLFSSVLVSGKEKKSHDPILKILLKWLLFQDMDADFHQSKAPIASWFMAWISSASFTEILSILKLINPEFAQHSKDQQRAVCRVPGRSSRKWEAVY